MCDFFSLSATRFARSLVFISGTTLLGMRKYLLLLLIISLFSCSKKKEHLQSARITGCVQNAVSDFLLIYDHSNIDTLFLDDEGNFKGEIQLDEPNYYTLTDNNEYAQLYLNPNDSLILFIDTQDFDESMSFLGRGAEVNRYLMDKFLIQEKFLDGESDAYAKDLPLYKKMLVSSKAKNMDMLEKLALKDSLFFNTEKNVILYEYANFLYRFPIHHYQARGVSIPLDSLGLSLAENLPVNDEKYLNHYCFMEYLNHRVEQYFNKNCTNDKLNNFFDYYKGRMMCMKKMPFSDGVLSYCLFNEIERGKNTLSEEDVLKLYDLFFKLSPKGDYYDRVERDFAQYNFDDSIFSCEDLSVYDASGNMVDIDWGDADLNIVAFWATYCSSSIDELSLLEDFPKEINGNKLNIMVVSMEDSLDHWGGIANLFSDRLQQYCYHSHECLSPCKGLDLEMIPYFILLDKEGKVVKRRLPWPSDHMLDYLKKLNY